MKQLAIILSAVLIINNVQAQSIKKIRPESRHMQFINSLLQQQSMATGAAKGTGITGQRVIAQSTRDNTLATLNDSVDLKYGPNRGSTYDYNTMIFPYNYPYSTTPLFNFAGTFAKPQVLFDTMTRWMVDPNTLIYGYFQTDYAGYDASYNMITYKSIHADSSIYPNMIYANTFSTVKNPLINYASNYIAGVADSAFKQYFTYNTSNKLTKDSTYELHLGVWRLASKTLYTYNTSGNLAQVDCYQNVTDTSFLLPLVEQLKYVNTYDASNRLLTVLDSTYTGTVLDQYVKDTFAYTGSLTFHTAWREHQWDPINHYWAPQFNMTKHINSSNKPDTVLIQGFDSLLNSWVPQTMDIISYTSTNDPHVLDDYEYNFTAYPTTPDFTTTYYYQTYTNTIGIKNIAAEPAVHIYPNPTTGAITISGLDLPASSSVSIAIINPVGQLLSFERQLWQGEVHVSMQHLAPGSYRVAIYDGSGSLLHQQAVVKE